MASKDLFEPLTFRNGLTARNRIALAPMTNQQSHADGTLSDDELRWLALRAEGGFGVVATCAAHVTLDGQGWPGELGIYDDKLLPGLTRLAAALRERGTVSIVQIFHGGARADASVTGTRPWSASEIEGDPANPRAATPEDIQRVIAAFRDAAVRAHRAGFDGVQLHGAHGYLLGQFLSATGNKRDDAYGGSFENRARLLREATRAVRAAVPASFLVGVRISPEDWGQAKGLDLDESLTLTGWLGDDGIDFLGVSLWDSFANTKKRPAEHPIPLFRRALPANVPLFVAGKIWTRAEAESLLALGADGVSLARAGILNPDWPLRTRDAAWEPRRPPMSAEDLLERGLSPKFVDYMRRWKGFVADETR
ncbi:NADH:flavin oxidoreductase [Polyangium mundeleinium]|uniref:NADH:flavin oxidoreductase n=1 Tax=Polyangium mundeleinium TaxID=2995306 RepID=A0ABT5F5A8_9BACT|nr:NADH:flavin oxidoreductase [Polyangium mundeleinium]MDC0749273.1 NADH:flavin oxidoreductase [Polyangium mundeleinium]